MTEKLTKTNYLLWKVQVLPAVHATQLEGYLDGTVQAPPTHNEEKDKDGKPILTPNPAYTTWVTRDQQLMSYLLSSMSKDVLAQVATTKTAAQVWSTLEEIYASETRARAVNTRIALATAKKGATSVAEYVSKMKALGDEMASAGKALDEEELVHYILTGIDDMEYNPVVSAVLARLEAITVNELLVQL